ncbi:iron chelate uptake ABC transporter family permease subunit [Stenotrophomonas maltophilia]|uniref:iron chelate uptake ABC transporter family permease subunit n=1 Tax=Stenotrophomonas maltophilia TaxID=40324 RepID=UPI001D0F76CC|nr:iron chelate uptake ABC transporter family permease subunit [Stenotrophomonas maltophilia]UKJ25474.1 iron chelate uptake ABC transporter family permease subunit [Stenotrophomonas maltophilia]UXB15812.1 iron chelate uptake ABC transporter family permease subunit [Stenotrophomonas maltophilia]WDW04429.1 iron chelate uptake ABC transporter family permease subunit [Stenotrophomonas maltophilia]
MKKSARTALVAGSVFLLLIVSLCSGVADIEWRLVLSHWPDGIDWVVLTESRWPRTAAVALAGAGLSVAGLVMQMLARNRFAEPSTTGTVEAAALGALLVALFAPAATVLEKILGATSVALLLSGVFLQLIRALPPRSGFVVPLVGLIFGAILHSVATLIALRYHLTQALHGWDLGDFSSVLKGRYEPMWMLVPLIVAAYAIADRLTLMGLGSAVARSLGVNYRRTLTLGLALVCAASSIVVVCVGSFPFLGLVVPNLVRLRHGDNVRAALPRVALMGAGLTLICDILGRHLVAPYELPASTIAGVIGAIAVVLLLRSKHVHAD